MVTKQERELLSLLSKGQSLDEAAKELDLGDGVYSIANSLAVQGLIKLKERRDRVISLGVDGTRYAKEGLPEKRLLTSMKRAPVPLSHLSNDMKVGIMWVKKKGWGEIKEGKLWITEEGNRALEREGRDEELLRILSSGSISMSRLQELGDFEKDVEELRRRGNTIKLRDVRLFEATLTPEGKKVLEQESTPSSPEKGISLLTHKMLKTGSWRGKKFRRYGIREAEEIWPARLHPLKIAIERIRRIFLEMGFSEARGDFVESSFWNFDALFQPQDHPARDLADTFYIDNLTSDLPPFHKQVRDMHEHGGDTESTGWQYNWDPKKAMQTVLRTHTTAVSARSLPHTEIPSKIFSIGRVFRNETLDYKHLAEFYQVEGIVVGEDVTFRHLLWYLREFYQKLGFKKIRFRPAYFPYTEMSCEPEVYFEEKREWVELGGSGIFRPEVVKPLLGREVPVLAWGLGIERPLMLKMGLNDLRVFYRNNIEWLRSYKTREVF